MRDYSTSTLATAFTRPATASCVDTVPRPQFTRTFSTTHSLGAGQVRKSHLRRARKQLAKRNESASASSTPDSVLMAENQNTPLPASVQTNPPSPESAASQRLSPTIRKVHKDFDPPRSTERPTQKPSSTQEPQPAPQSPPLRVRRMIAQHPASSTSPSRPSSALSETESTRELPQDKPTRPGVNKNQLPRLLRQLQDPVSVPLPSPHERAQGATEKDFEKLVRYLWREYYRVVSAVRKVTAGVPGRKEGMKKKGVKMPAKKDGAVRRVESESGKAIGGTTAEQCFESMKLSGRHLTMLTEQIRFITGLKGGSLSGWTAWKTRKRPSRLARLSGRKRPLIRTVRLATQTPSRPRLTSLRRGRLPHRNSSGLDFTMRSIPVSLSTPSSSASPAQPDLSPKPVSFGRRGTHTLGALRAQASRTIKRVQVLSAQTRVLLPNAPVLISTHSSRIMPRSKTSRRPTLMSDEQARTTGPTGSELQQRAPRGTAGHIRRALRSQRVVKRPRGEKVQPVRARRVLEGGWKKLSKHLVGRKPLVRAHLAGEWVTIRKMKKTTKKGKLADDVGAWLKGDSLDELFK